MLYAEDVLAQIMCSRKSFTEFTISMLTYMDFFAIMSKDIKNRRNRD